MDVLNLHGGLNVRISCSNYVWCPSLPFTTSLPLFLLPESVPSSREDKWIVIVDRASLLFIQALSGLHKLQEQSWRVLELHSLKIVSSGIIWVSLQEVGCLICACVCARSCVWKHVGMCMYNKWTKIQRTIIWYWFTQCWFNGYKIVSIYTFPSCQKWRWTQGWTFSLW